EIGDARTQVVGVTGLERAGQRRRALAARRAGHPRRSALRRREVALCGELRVGLEHNPARDPQAGGERPRRPQASSSGQAGAADLVAELGLELLVERSRTPFETYQQVGPRNWHCIGRHDWTLTVSQLPRSVSSPRTRMETSMDEITIIGGGLAGLTAAISAAE